MSSSDSFVEMQALLDVPFDFERQAEPVAAAVDPRRRLPLTLLLVAKSHGAGASWKGLQLLSWAVRDQRHGDLLVALTQGVDIPDRPIVRIEPALDRAIDLAVGLGLLEQKSARVFRLTEAGRRLVREIENTAAFELERSVLSRLHGKVTQTLVDRLLEWRDS